MHSRKTQTPKKYFIFWQYLTEIGQRLLTVVSYSHSFCKWWFWGNSPPREVVAGHVHPTRTEREDNVPLGPLPVPLHAMGTLGWTHQKVRVADPGKEAARNQLPPGSWESPSRELPFCRRRTVLIAALQGLLRPTLQCRGLTKPETSLIILVISL